LADIKVSKRANSYKNTYQVEVGGWQERRAVDCPTARERLRVGEESLAREEGFAAGVLRMQLEAGQAPVDVDPGSRGYRLQCGGNSQLLDLHV
jgi:hypothetical protein